MKYHPVQLKDTRERQGATACLCAQWFGVGHGALNCFHPGGPLIRALVLLNQPCTGRAFHTRGNEREGLVCLNTGLGVFFLVLSLTLMKKVSTPCCASSLAQCHLCNAATITLHIFPSVIPPHKNSDFRLKKIHFYFYSLPPLQSLP